MVEGEIKPITADDAYYILEAATNVAIIPGYGMAVAQAQHVVKELTELLEKNGCEVNFRHSSRRRPHARAHERPSRLRQMYLMTSCLRWTRLIRVWKRWMWRL